MPPSGYDQLTSSHHDTVPLHGGMRRVSQLNTSPPTGKGGIRKAVREDRPGGNLHPKFGLSVEHRVGEHQVWEQIQHRSRGAERGLWPPDFFSKTRTRLEHQVWEHQV